MRRSLQVVCKMPFLILYLSTFLIISNSYSQVEESWVKRYTTSVYGQDNATAITVDVAGNVYVTGSSEVNETNYDFATIKYNSDGEQLWLKRYNGPGNGLDFAKSVVVDADGNVFITGVSDGDGSNSDFATIKYNSDGVELWVKRYNGPVDGADDPCAMVVDADGNVYVTGFSDQDGISLDYATVKYNSTGDYQWLRTYDGQVFGHDRPNAMAVDASGNIYITGSSNNNENDYDIVTMKYFPNGNMDWIKRYKGAIFNQLNSNDFGIDITVDAAGNLYILGSGRGENPDVGFLPYGDLSGDRDYIILSYNNNGEERWFQRFSGLDNLAESPQAMVLDAAANVYVTGFSRKSSGELKIATIKYNSNGERQWIRESINSIFIGSIIGSTVGIDVDIQGNIYVASGVKTTDDQSDYVTIKYSAEGMQKWVKTYDGPSSSQSEDRACAIVLDINGNIYITGSSTNLESGEDYLTIKYEQCSIICPQNVVINTDPGACGAVVNFSANVLGVCADVIYTHAAYGTEVFSGTFFSKGHHHIIAKSESTGETCGFTIEVNDTELPVITKCPAGVTVSCASEVPDPDITLVEATDNCNSVTIAHVSDVKTNETCANRFTLTRTYSAADASGNSTTCIQIITVYDGTPPVISGLAATPTTLWPPNHKMKDIVLNYTVTDNCNVAPVTLSIKSNEPDNGTSDGDTDQDFLVTDNYNVKLRAERASNGDGRIYEIKVTADDGCNDPVSATTPVVVAHNIKSPISGASHKIGSTVNLEGDFWDKPGNTHTATWMVDNTTAKGIVTEPEGLKNGKVTGSYKFSTAGVYKLQMNVKDQHGIVSYANTNGDVDAIVVIYDPNGGNAYGGGWFASPKGAMKYDPNATGKVSFGFASSYFKKATSPKGETQMEFKIGALEFNALNFEYLVITNARAQFKGSGRINGDRAGYDFIMTVIDGKIDGSGTDKIRLKIFNKNTGEIIYDNQPGASDADDPKTTVGVGSEIVIITGKKQGIREDLDYITEANDKFGVKLFPNPTTSTFNLVVNSLDKSDVQVKVFNSTGQLIGSMKVVAGQNTSFGNELKAGMYFIEVVQGENKRTVKLIKF